MANDHANGEAPGGATRRARRVEESLPEPRIDDVLRALADRQRRFVLGYLLGEDPDPVPVSDLIDHVVNVVDEPPGTVRARIHHSHLPRLEDAGMIERDPGAGTLSFRGPELTRDLLETLAGASELSYRPPAASRK